VTKLDSDDPFRDLEPLHNVVPIREDTPFPPPNPEYAPGGQQVQNAGAEIKPTPFVWRDPLTIPPRPWVYGRHMIRKQVSVTVAPGGVGKSSLTLVEAICLASGRQLLGEWVPHDCLTAWVYNLEDPRDELNRRVIGAMIHHGVKPEEVEGRLYLDTGRERPLCTAIDIRGEVIIVRPEMDALAAALTERKIDVLIVDPFVSSHRVSENSSGAIDLVAKEWARLADRCNCAIELVHHTRKTGGVDATTEDGRGSSALLSAARSGRVLNKMHDEDRAKAGVESDPATYFGIDRDKANLAPSGVRQWVRMASVDLGQGDHVGVAERWTWPDAFDGIGVRHLIDVQREVHRRHEAGTPPRFSDQAGSDWIGAVIGDICGLDPDADKAKIKTILKGWMATESLVKETIEDQHRKKRPVILVGEWAFE
jgi:AAA domain